MTVQTQIASLLGGWASSAPWSRIRTPHAPVAALDERIETPRHAAIGHQRGRRNATHVPQLISYLNEVADDRRFFIAKAVGWALRDLAAIDLNAAQTFVRDHPRLPAIARREALRGIERAAAKR